MSRSRYVAMGIAALWLQWTSCSVEEIDLTGKECPCADGWTCDLESNLCVKASPSGGGGSSGSGGGQSGGGGGGDASVDQSADAPNDAPQAPVALGRACIGSQLSTATAANRKRVSRFALFSQETYDAVMIYLVPPTSGTQQVRGIVYSVGGNGQPDALVGATTEASIGTSFVKGWVSMAFDTPLPLEPGEYWVGIHSGPNGTAKYSYENAPAALRFADDTYSDGPAATYGATTNGDNLLSVYLQPAGATIDDSKPCPSSGGTGGTTGGGGSGGTTGGGGSGGTTGGGGTGAKGGTGGTTGGTGGTSTGGSGGAGAGGSGGTSTGGSSQGGSGGGSNGGSGGSGGVSDAGAD